MAVDVDGLKAVEFRLGSDRYLVSHYATESKRVPHASFAIWFEPMEREFALRLGTHLMSQGMHRGHGVTIWPSVFEFPRAEG